MRAGPLSYWIEILEPIRKGGFGGATEWPESGTRIRAERVNMTGKRGVDSSEVMSEYSVSWRVRSTHNVKVGSRVLYDGGTYEVKAVIPNRRRGMLTLITETINI